MAQATATGSFAQRMRWDDRIKPALIVIVIAGLAYLVGTYMVAPRMAAALPTNMPATLLAMPLGAVTVVHEDGTAALLPVRLADTAAHRSAGFKDVGAQAMDTTFLLYVLPRETTTRTTYAVEGTRAPLEFAAIDASGAVVSVTAGAAGGDRVAITDRHQWVLVAKAGLLDRFGVGVGSTIDPAGIRTF